MLNTIPNLEMRLACWVYKCCFDENADDVHQPLLLCKQGCKVCERMECVCVHMCVHLCV